MPTSATSPVRRPRGAALAAVAAVAVLLTVVLTAFAWPAVRSAPHDLPLAVAGPPAAVEQVTTALGSAAPGAFDVRPVGDEAAARAAIEEREVHGAVVVDTGGPRLLVASAASPTVANSLRQVAAGLGAATGAPVPVEDVVPAPEADPRGAGLAAAALPLALGGIVTAGLTSRLVRGRGRRVATALAAAVAGGTVTATVLGSWLGSVEGSWWTTSAVVAFGIAATALVLLGLHELLGTPGLALGAATTVLLGNPLSGLSGAPDLLPGAWGTVGQWLPPGATGTLLRVTSWFDGAGAGPAALTLTVWCLAGLALIGLAAARARRSQPVAPAPVTREAVPV
ncbi:hypothetical protein SAMN04488107_1451 [Geodermatophilus saharensis]|uniref:ABC-2 family transporter protein n=1 Tax=Geodermatophilus saharensis TaxID=1137994 RepID=A0A239BWH0_9ACTN|nr:hypothetical protein [Geodermatophilus saharensis]SNS11781.1 hypothetical protein SAMN04488107_1451 [Geodermatophilus saharensis]